MFDESRLDDVAAIETRDSQSTLRALASGGAHLRRAVQASHEARLDRLADLSPRGVVVAAAGGSACVADIFEALTRAGAALPVQTCTRGPLPGWVGALDLVVAVSLSGRAAGPLHLAAEAVRRGATLLTVGAADSPLAELAARSRGIHVAIDTGAVSSRTGVWAQAAPVLLAADALGLASVTEQTLAGIADVLDERATDCRPSSESFVNPAKVLAVEVAESSTIVLGSGPLGEVAARRAVAMFGRTGRTPVAFGALPDAASQVVACFDGPLAGGETRATEQDDIFADPFLDGPRSAPLRLVMLRDVSPDNSAAQQLERSVVAAAEDAGVRVSLVESPSTDPLLRLASHIALTDFAATYLALGQGYDPATSPHVRLLRDVRPDAI